MYSCKTKYIQFLSWNEFWSSEEGTKSSGEMVCPPFPTKGIPIPLHVRDSVVVIHNEKNSYNSLPNSGTSSNFISTLVTKQETPLERFSRIRLCCRCMVCRSFPSWWYLLPQSFWHIFLISDIAGEGCGFCILTKYSELL